jgi:hypothetical protein
VETQNVTLSFWRPEEQGERFVPNENGIALRVAASRTPASATWATRTGTS